MVCKQCGHSLPSDAALCTQCGWKTPLWNKQKKEAKKHQIAEVVSLAIGVVTFIIFVLLFITNL